MDLERRLRRHYLLRDAAEVLAWSPALVLGLILAVGFHLYERPRVVDANLERAFSLSLWLVLASPAGTLVGLGLLWLTRRAADTWSGGELHADAAARRDGPPRRLGGYTIRRIHTHRETGIRLVRFRLTKPFRFTVNSALTAFGIWFVLHAIREFGGATRLDPVRFGAASLAMLVATGAVLIWVNRRWICTITHDGHRARLAVMTRSGPMFSRALKGTLTHGPLEAQRFGNEVTVCAGDQRVNLIGFSAGRLGDWEAGQMVRVVMDGPG